MSPHSRLKVARRIIPVEIIRERLFGEPPRRAYGHAYSITPTNFRILSEEKQRRRLTEFFEMLKMLEHAATITLERVPITVREEGNSQANDGRMDVLRVMLDTPDPLDDVLERLGFSYTIDEPRDALEVTAQRIRDFACMVNGSPLYGRAYTVYGAPAALPPAWVHDVFGTFHRLQIHVTPIRPDDALRKMENRELLYSGVRTSRADIRKKLRDIRALKQELELGNTSAFAFTVNGFVFAASRQELRGLHRTVKRNTRAMNVRVTTSLGRQRHIVLGGGVSWLGAVHSMHVLYPFVSSDMLEAPNGVTLGRNLDTQGPVIYDINLRKNHNVFTAGTTGSGKSFTNKILLKRFLEKRPDTMCIVIDPQGEYAEHSEYFGLDRMEISPGQEYGLDPFAMFDSAVEAADLLGAATNAPNQTRKEWRSICDTVRSVGELYEASSETAKGYLADLVRGSISRVFRGVPRFSDRMVISLRKTDGQEYEGLLILLVLVYAWRRVNELPAKRWKFVLLDEAWRMTKIDHSIRKIGEMARQGRKRSLIFAVSTQQFSDMDRALDDESKLTELFDTKVIMQVSQSAARVVGAALGLTEPEIERVTNFRSGMGLLQTSDNAIYLRFEATADEARRYFNTKKVQE